MGNNHINLRNINIPILQTTSNPQSHSSQPPQTQRSSSCKHVQRYLDIDGWCKRCTMKSVNSGHEGLDKFIRQTQKKSSSWDDPFLEWIPFENFRDVCRLDEGGFGVVYSATWIQGRYKCIRG